LREEGLSDEEARYVVENAGGVPWFMERILDKLNMMNVKEAVNTLYLIVRNSIEEKLRTLMIKEGKEKKKVAMEVLKEVLDRGRVEEEEEKIKMVRKLVELEILYYDPINGRITPHTKLHGKAIRKLLESSDGV